MRILLGIDTWSLVGGSERYAIQLSAELRSRGHEVGVLCGELRRDTPAPAETFVHPAYSRERSSRAELDQLEQTIRSFSPEVLLLLTARGRAATRRMTDLVNDLPVVRFVQDHTLFCPGLTKLHADGRTCTEPLGLACLRHYFLEQGCTAFRPALHRSKLDAFGGVWKWKRQLDVARRASCLLAASGYMRDELVAAGIPRTRIEVLPYFTHSGTPHSPLREPGKETQDFVLQSAVPVVLAPARLTLPEKGLDRLLEAIARIDPPLRLVIAGTGPAEKELRQLSRQLSLAERVLFTGWQDAQTLEWLYSHCSVVAFPSMWAEPFGLVGIEAMAHGKPVVAFDVGGVREWLVPGVTGLLSPRGDVEDLARQLSRLICDPALRQTLGDAGRVRQLEHFTPARHAEVLETLLSRLAAGMR